MRNLTLRLTALAAILSLAACAEKPLDIPTGQPSFYRSMASRDAKVDTEAARDLISIYRRNNGLSTVSLDPILQAEAQKQAEAMAAADSMSHDVRGSLQRRLDGSGLAHSMAVENISAGYHTLAQFAPSQRQHAQWQDAPHGHRQRLCAGHEVQGVLGAGDERLKAHSAATIPASAPFTQRPRKASIQRATGPSCWCQPQRCWCGRRAPGALMRSAAFTVQRHIMA